MTSPDGLVLEDGPHHIITADRTGTCCLILDGVTPKDSGQYVCYASSPVGHASTLAKMVVDGECNDGAVSRKQVQRFNKTTKPRTRH